MRNADVLEAIASPAWATEVGQFNLEINVPPRLLDGDALAALETRAPRRPQRRRRQGPHRGQPPGHGRHPAHAGRSTTWTPGRHVGQRALQGAERADLRRPRRGHADRDRRRRAAARPTATASRPSPPAPACSCTSRSAPDAFANYWNAAQAIAGVAGGAGRQLPVPVRQAALARDQDHAVRAGHRHPLGRAEGAGRAAPGVVRRALDHLGLRPVRGEPQVLPRAAADLRGRGPAGRAGPGRLARSSPR